VEARHAAAAAAAAEKAAACAVELRQIREAECVLRKELAVQSAAHTAAAAEAATHSERLARMAEVAEDGRTEAVGQLEAERARVVQLEREVAELREQLEGLKAAEEKIEQLRSIENELEKSRQRSQQLEADVSMLRGDEQGGGAVSQALGEVEAARKSLNHMTEMMAKSKADRAALVDYALRSLTQLSAHLSLTLAGLRLGSNGQPMLNVHRYPPHATHASAARNGQPGKKEGSGASASAMVTTADSRRCAGSKPNHDLPRWHGARSVSGVGMRARPNLMDEAGVEVARHTVESTVDQVKQSFRLEMDRKEVRRMRVLIDGKPDASQVNASMLPPIPSVRSIVRRSRSERRSKTV